jgi:hypothetical protein
MNELQLRKQALLLESELNRAALRADLARLSASAAWVDEAIGFARQSKPLVVALGAGAGLLLARRLTGAQGGGGMVSRLLRWGQMAYTVWQGVSSWRRRNAEPPPAP